ncbi:hypothetical protein [Dyadobacter sandarakinus]|uniref:Uncharacterized protein n=1 Tax=Dyadobacter sandarakinus TaxID=2747268 RepID=A0ABX7I1U4_9BACT|nr:hypothetical protein [Dyadobacter sandarakinus]QRQ99819.1 hypothetical protein HWI92_02235 [Dyadobacter sandarakinus]
MFRTLADVVLNRFSKQWIGLSLLLLMLVKAWLIPLICLDYEVRKDYIAKTLCVNRNRPMLNCNGKCYLAKRLAQAEKQQQRQAEQDYLSSLIYQVMDTGNRYTFTTPAPVLEDNPAPSFIYRSALWGHLATDSIFHPPLV